MRCGARGAGRGVTVTVEANVVTVTYRSSGAFKRPGERELALMKALVEAASNFDFDAHPTWVVRVVDAPSEDKLRRFHRISVEWGPE